MPSMSGSKHLVGVVEKTKKLTLYCVHRHPFTPPKLSAYIDEAKTYAAEYTLQTLGIPTEGAEVPPAAPAFPGMGTSVHQRSPGILLLLLAPLQMSRMNPVLATEDRPGCTPPHAFSLA